jgi:hypothetical protein
MKKCGLRTPPIEKIPHYSYVMLRPDSKTKLGPGHPERQAEFSNKIRTIAEKFGTGLVEHVPS